jgi:hypothetical protein
MYSGVSKGKHFAIYEFIPVSNQESDRFVVCNGQHLDITKLILKVPKPQDEMPSGDEMYNNGKKKREDVLRSVLGAFKVQYEQTSNGASSNPDLKIYLPKYYIFPDTLLQENGQLHDGNPKVPAFKASYILVEKLGREITTDEWKNSNKTLDQLSSQSQKFLLWAQKILTRSATKIAAGDNEVLPDFRPRNCMELPEGVTGDLGFAFCDIDFTENLATGLAGYLRDFADANEYIMTFLMKDFPSSVAEIVNEKLAKWRSENNNKLPAAQVPETCKKVKKPAVALTSGFVTPPGSPGRNLNLEMTAASSSGAAFASAYHSPVHKTIADQPRSFNAGASTASAFDSPPASPVKQTVRPQRTPKATRKPQSSSKPFVLLPPAIPPMAADIALATPKTAGSSSASMSISPAGASPTPMSTGVSPAAGISPLPGNALFGAMSPNS